MTAPNSTREFWNSRAESFPRYEVGADTYEARMLQLARDNGVDFRGKTVLDVGCGSGILSIAALTLGAAHADGLDIDPKAVDVAYENAALNGIGRDRYTVRAGDILSDRALAAQLACQSYHLVLANIVADVIIPLSAQVPALLAEDGVFLCSGIIDTRAHEVEEALVRQGLTLTGRREKNGWVALEARCPSPRGPSPLPRRGRLATHGFPLSHLDLFRPAQRFIRRNTQKKLHP